ncbi:MAG: 1,4-alpha-glucan branching protein GlgB [Deltaproteobacteria bacterium]|nr:1,4-alpha-glucan branching protein GlgB [Myxococcales bacterium]MDP3214111.1 1,4-alpha-glucan branching protein GlgB [Deltaproteobacteria bacterium]
MSPANDPPAGDARRLGELDLHLFNEGSHTRLYDHLGAHPGRVGAAEGTHFAVWAPEAEAVGVAGDWDHWGEARALTARGSSGLWEGFVPGAAHGHRYKYRIRSKHGGVLEKADPFGFLHEAAPATASVVWAAEHAWDDAAWMARRAPTAAPDAPMSIYELHLGSWRRKPEEGGRSLTYRELAPLLADHVTRLGFTHVELMPVMEHPFFGSWGYQVTGFFAPSSRFGPPEDLMFLIDLLHQRGVGVILDWVPSHFPTDPHGLYAFDGSHLFEHADPRRGIHPHWTSAQFNYGRHEVRSFLLSSAHFWLDRFHADGLRVDGVASMLYLDYGREAGQWEPNRHGGREDLDAVEFLRALNTTVGRDHPGVVTIAEESTAWPGVTRQAHLGGLGFGYKWDMGWMHDTLVYLSRDPVHRAHHHGELTFRPLYAYSEHFVLALSHDESVHGKGSLLGKMAGDAWQKRANLRLLLAYQWALPGKKLVFMGAELGQWREWNHDDSLDWHLLDDPDHAGIALLVGELNRLYRTRPSLHRGDCRPSGFEWVVPGDGAQSVLAFERVDGPRRTLVVINATPVPRYNYRVGVGVAGYWSELLNTDARAFGGAGLGNHGGVEASPVAAHGRPFSLNLTLPPLGVLLLSSSPLEDD